VNSPTIPASPLQDATRDGVLKVCREVLAPLVRADGGILYLVSANADDIHIHLAGTCAGCPGAAITRDGMMEPALKPVAPKGKLRVTTGWRVPAGAEKID
jgi:Fe-S cluster biogenesis protein NfuA